MSSETWMAFVNKLSPGENKVRIEVLSEECKEASYQLGREYVISEPMAIGEFTLVVGEGEKIELKKLLKMDLKKVLRTQKL